VTQRPREDARLKQRSDLTVDFSLAGAQRLLESAFHLLMLCHDENQKKGSSD